MHVVNPWLPPTMFTSHSMHPASLSCKFFHRLKYCRWSQSAPKVLAPLDARYQVATIPVMATQLATIEKKLRFLCISSRTISASWKSRNSNEPSSITRSRYSPTSKVFPNSNIPCPGWPGVLGECHEYRRVIVTLERACLFTKLDLIF